MTLNLMTHRNNPSETTPEERQLKNERTRIESMIRSYNRNPKNYNAQMEASLERMATQYQIPFKRQVPEANIAQKGGAFLGGIVDSVALDFIPDDWYSSEATNSAKNWGKGVGTAAFIAGTLGAGAAAKGAVAGAKAIGGRAAAKVAAKKAASKASRTTPGTNFTTTVDDVAFTGQKSVKNPQGIQGPKVGETKLTGPGKDVDIAAPGNTTEKLLEKADPEKIKELAEGLGQGLVSATEKAGLTAPGFLAGFGKESIKKGIREIGLIKNWKWAQKSLSDDLVKAAKSENPNDIVKLLTDVKIDKNAISKTAKALKDTHGNNAYTKSIIAELKGSGSSLGGSVDDIKMFINKIGNNKKVTAANIEKIGKQAKLSKETIKEITENLVNNKIDNFSDVKKFLIASGKTPSIDILKAAQNKDLWMGIGASAAATRPVTGIGFGEGLTSTYDEKLEEMYDPMNTVG